MKKKLLAMLLTVCMVMGMTNIPAYAAEVGSKENPELMTGQHVTTVIEEGDTDGYYYKYVAEKDGVLCVGPTSSFEEDYTIHGVAYSVNDGEIYYNRDNVALSAYNAKKVTVKAGEEVLLWVNTYELNTNTPPAGKIYFHVNFYEGTEEKPVGGSEDIFYHELAAGESCYYNHYVIYQGSKLIINNSNVEVEYHDTIYKPENGVIEIPLSEDAESATSGYYIKYKVTNTSNEKTNVTVNIESPIGTPKRMDTDMLGEHTVSFEEDNLYGYNYVWVATSDGKLTVEISGKTWGYHITNHSNYNLDYSGDGHFGKIQQLKQ